MAQNRLILDYVLDHEEKLRDRVYMTQPIGNNQVVDTPGAQTVDQARRMAAHLQSRGFPARRARRDSVEELRALHHGRTGDLDGRLHDRGDLPDRDRRNDQLRADAQRGEPALRRQARHAGRSSSPACRPGLPCIAFPLAPKTEFDTWDAIVGTDGAARRPTAARRRRTGDADLHLRFDRARRRA